MGTLDDATKGGTVLKGEIKHWATFEEVARTSVHLMSNDNSVCSLP